MNQLILHPTATYMEQEQDTYQEIIKEENKQILLGCSRARHQLGNSEIEWVIEILSPNEVAPPLPPTTRIYRFEFEDNRHIHLQEWIDNILPIIHQETGRGLLHCREGRSRSPSILLAYLMRYHRMTYDDALTLVRSKRPVVRPNPGFERQLRAMQPSHT